MLRQRRHTYVLRRASGTCDTFRGCSTRHKLDYVQRVYCGGELITYYGAGGRGDDIPNLEDLVLGTDGFMWRGVHAHQTGGGGIKVANNKQVWGFDAFWMFAGLRAPTPLTVRI